MTPIRCLLLTTLLLAGAETGSRPAPRTASELFARQDPLTIHLTFTAEEWAAMEPKGGQGGRGGPGGHRGPGGPGMPGMQGMPGMPPLGGLIAPAILNGADSISKKQFQTLAANWYKEWAKANPQAMSTAEFQAGLASKVTLPEMPGFGPGGPGGPGGRPGMGMGMAAAPSADGKKRRNGMSGMQGVDFQYVHANVDINGVKVGEVGVRYKGNSTYMASRGSIKRPMKIEFNHFVKGQKFVGLTKLNLQNHVNDPSAMNESLSYRMFREAGVPSPRTTYAKVYLTVAGQYENKYLGLYTVAEDIDKAFAADRYGVTTGAIFKPSTRQLFQYLGEDWSKYDQMYDPKTELTKAQKERVYAFSRLVTEASDADFALKLPEYLNLQEFARFLGTTVWLSSLDSILGMGQNFYVYLHPKTNQFEFLPWDLDHSFGHFPMAGSAEQREQLSIWKPYNGQNRFLERVLKVEAFRKVYAAEMKQIQEKLGRPERFAAQVDELAKVLRPAIAEENEKLVERFDAAAAGKEMQGGGFGGGMRGGPGGPGGFGGPMGGGKPIKTFVVARAASVGDQLSGKSEGAALQGGGPGGRGMGGPGGRGPGGPGGFNPAQMFLRPLVAELDPRGTGTIPQEKFLDQFEEWFTKWDTDKKGVLTRQQLEAGLSQLMAAGMMGGQRGPGGFGGPGGPPPFEF